MVEGGVTKEKRAIHRNDEFAGDGGGQQQIAGSETLISLDEEALSGDRSAGQM